MTPGEPMPATAAERSRAARDDLAQRLDVDPGDVSIVRMDEVTWPDASLGCPQPGMAYAQVLTSGHRIILECGGRRYDYHSGGRRPPFLCPDPPDAR